MAAVWQSVDIKGEIPANATMDPCSPMASITMKIGPHQAQISWIRRFTLLGGAPGSTMREP